MRDFLQSQILDSTRRFIQFWEKMASDVPMEWLWFFMIFPYKIPTPKMGPQCQKKNANRSNTFSQGFLCFMNKSMKIKDCFITSVTWKIRNTCQPWFCRQWNWWLLQYCLTMSYHHFDEVILSRIFLQPRHIGCPSSQVRWDFHLGNLAWQWDLPGMFNTEA
jgi:hypothetical protein